MKARLAKMSLLCVLSAPMLFRQTLPEGLWEGYDGEWKHVSQQLIALAEATPAEKFAWRPAPGVRSTSEVYMHIALANFYLLSVTGPKMPAELRNDSEKSFTSVEKRFASKVEVVDWLKRSLDAVKEAHLAAKPADLARKVHIHDREATVDGIYLRIIVHDNEHMGQLIAYARRRGPCDTRFVAKRPRDPVQLAKQVFDIAIGEAEDTVSESKRNPPEGRAGGLKGGKARAKRLTSQDRSAIARKAARTRWVRTEE
jgi:uncharacterized damage-inducible protein DinB